jgi:hypothetical protein
MRMTDLKRDAPQMASKWRRACRQHVFGFRDKLKFQNAGIANRHSFQPHVRREPHVPCPDFHELLIMLPNFKTLVRLCPQLLHSPGKFYATYNGRVQFEGAADQGGLTFVDSPDPVTIVNRSCERIRMS